MSRYAPPGHTSNVTEKLGPDFLPLPSGPAQMLDSYDLALGRSQSRVTRAKRLVADVVDASLPKALVSIAIPRPAALTEHDVEAELEALLID